MSHDGRVARYFGSWSALIDPFERHGADAYATLCRACAEDPKWGSCDQPLPALHAVRLASFSGRATDPFGGDAEAFLRDLDALGEEVTNATDRGLVQFTEPLRLADVIPGLLLASCWAQGRPLRLVELGTSVGLLLAPELFTVHYPRGRWDPTTALAEMTSDLDVPPTLLAQPLTIADRVGVDLAPVDPRDPRSYDYLRAFGWPGDDRREQRLRAALDVLCQHPSPVRQGDAVATLPDLLTPDRDVVTVVVESALSSYLSGPQALRLGRTLDAFAARTPLMLLTRAAEPEEPVLTSNMTLIDLSNRRRVKYCLADMLCERTRWVGSAE